MSTELPFSNNTIQVYAYEGFSYTISNPNPSTYTLQTVSNSSGFGANPSPIYFTKNDNDSYTFSVSDLSNNLTAGTSEAFLLQANGVSSSNTVIVNAGRFLDGSGLSLSNASYTFYKQETIQPIRFVAPSFTLNRPTTIPALPPGLSFVNVTSNIWDLAGVPLTTVPTSNYQVIGTQTGGSKVITTRLNMTVSNERVQVSVSGAPIISMAIGTPIEPRVITSIPPVGSSVVRYTYPQFPDGIVVTDICGNVQSGTTFTPSDASYTMVISGTPTSNAAYAFRNAGAGAAGLVYPVQVSRTVPLPLVSTTQGLTFAFGETVLFDLSEAPVLYTSNTVASNSVFYRAATYFAGTVGMSNIFSPDLRSDLSLVFVPSQSRANLVGSPSNAGAASYTIRAINSNGTQRDYVTPISVVNDAVTFSSPVGVDICYSFILSRPIDQSKSGYYPSNIQFVATADSRRPVILSAPALAGTGLSLNSNGLLVGTPASIIPLTDLVVTATVSGTSVSASKTVKFSILNDSFTISGDPSAFTFVQNVATTPFQIQATTLSGRNVVNYAQIGLPGGISISPAGVVSGTPTVSTPTSGTATITATTGYASGSRDFSYNLTPDSMLLLVPSNSYSYNAGDVVEPIDIDGVTYSGTTVSNYTFTLNPTYGLVLNSSNGILSGTWSTGIPPQTLLPSSSNFTINAVAKSLTGSLAATISAYPIVENAMLIMSYQYGFNNSSWMYYTTLDRVLSSNPSVTQIAQVSPVATQFVFKNNSPVSNVILSPVIAEPAGFLRGTRLNNLTYSKYESNDIYYPVISTIVNKPSTSTWWGGGRVNKGGDTGPVACIVKSIDDGVTWDLSGAKEIKIQGGKRVLTRDNNGTSVPFDNTIYPYVVGGLALAYSSDDGVLIAGGLSDGTTASSPMMRSTDEGTTWSIVSDGFGKECAKINVDNSSIWIAAGSSLYATNTSPPFTFTGAADTLKYSTDKGETWSNVTGGFTMFGYDVTYANNTWFAVGSSGNGSYLTTFEEEIRYSIDGSNWTKLDISTSPLVSTSSSAPFLAPLRTGPVVADDSNWYIIVNQGDLGLNTGTPKIYRHTLSGNLATDWVRVDIDASGWVANQPTFNQTARYIGFSAPKYLYNDAPPTTITLSFDALTGGPTFTSPISRSYVQYQYVSISPIQLAASGTGTIYFFVTAADLPPGLTFNPLTGQITGTPAQIGTVRTRVYAKDDTGTSFIDLTFTTMIPRVIRKQDGAGAYTSLLRQYTEVLGAQNARDNKVYPNQEAKLGEFMSPEAPDVITQTVDPRCYGPSNCP